MFIENVPAVRTRCEVKFLFRPHEAVQADTEAWAIRLIPTLVKIKMSPREVTVISFPTRKTEDINLELNWLKKICNMATLAPKLNIVSFLASRVPE